MRGLVLTHLDFRTSCKGWALAFSSAEKIGVCVHAMFVVKCLLLTILVLAASRSEDASSAGSDGRARTARREEAMKQMSPSHQSVLFAQCFPSSTWSRSTTWVALPVLLERGKSYCKKIEQLFAFFLLEEQRHSSIFARTSVNRNGTCYSSSECTSRGGQAQGSCASG